MPWGGAGGQNIEHPHTLVILSSFLLLQMHLLLLARRSSGDLRCSATAFIILRVLDGMFFCLVLTSTDRYFR